METGFPVPGRRCQWTSVYAPVEFLPGAAVDVYLRVQGSAGGVSSTTSYALGRGYGGLVSLKARGKRCCTRGPRSLALTSLRLVPAAKVDATRPRSISGYFRSDTGTNSFRGRGGVSSFSETLECATAVLTAHFSSAALLSWLVAGVYVYYHTARLYGSGSGWWW